MTSPSNGRKGAFASRPALARMVAIKRFLARLVLASEQLLPILLIPASVVALFLAVSWFGFFRVAPDLVRWLLLAGFAIAFVASLVPFRRLRWPTTLEADRLLEERNGLAHQPVTVQEDALSTETPFAKALWREHQARMAARIAALDAGFPRPDIAGYDRFALRAVPVLLLVTAFSFSMSNSGGSIRDAFSESGGGAHGPDIRIDAWITPPYYTGQAPTYLTGNATLAQNAISVPQFSDLTVRITGGTGDEKVTFQSNGSDQRADIAVQSADDNAKTSQANVPKAPPPPQAANADSAAASPNPPSARTHLMKLEKGGILAVGDQKWSFKLVADKPPEIAFDGLPRSSVSGALEIGFKAKDDYGIDEARAEIVPLDSDPQAKALYGLPEYKLDIVGRNRRDIKGLASHDLTQDPLAGKRVRVTLVAKDGAGQTGRSPPYEMTMPARNFQEPLAGAVAEERQVFALDTRKMPEAIALNEALTIRPDETIPDLSKYLLLQSARARMKLARGDDALKDTADYLWQIAIGMEDGQLSDAQKKLRDAQQKLSDALQRNAPDAEIKKLMDELRQAMNDYMKELAQRMQNAPPGQPNQRSATILRQQDLQRMMDQIENLARSGNRDAAQQMLSELQQMMNNLQAGRPQPGQQQQGQQNSEAQQQMDKLGQILRDQQKLMEQTFRLDQALKDRMQRGDQNEDGDDPFSQPMPGQPNQQQGWQQQQGQQDQQDQQQRGQQGQQGQNGQQGKSPTDGMTEDQLREALKQLRQQQDDLGKQLGELQKGLGKLGVKPGPGFGQAQREMEGAGKELGQGHGEPALQGQGRALEALRQGARDMMTQMMQAMQQQGGQQRGQGQQGQFGQGNQNGRDPLGRLRDGNDDLSDGGPKIPDEIDVQRAREILDAIRERLGNNPTQEEERRYLERLLDIQ